MLWRDLLSPSKWKVLRWPLQAICVQDRQVAAVIATMPSAVSHPYYPRDLKLPHYVPNESGISELLGVFFGIMGVAIVLTWFMAGKNSSLSLMCRVKICWFMTCALIHTFLEGYFSVYHKTLAGKQTFLAQLWKEYGNADSRYISSDTFTVCMETITAFVDGPLSFLAVYAFMKDKPYRYTVQLILSLCQLYGDVLYFSTEVFEGFTHGEMWHPLYFWFYFVFLNGLWIVIPLCCIVQSCSHLNAAQHTQDTQGEKNIYARKKLH